MLEVLRRNKIPSILPQALACGLFTALLAGCVAAEEPLPEVPDAKRVFASSATMTGNLGGLAGADALCGTWAQAANLTGTWKAFLSTSGVNAIDRISEAGPWYNVTRQVKIFNNKTGFTVGSIAAIPTEYNTGASGHAWTGTGANGMANGTQNCSNWTQGVSPGYASVGTPVSNLDNGARWMATGGNVLSCASSFRVYCFEQ